MKAFILFNSMKHKWTDAETSILGDRAATTLISELMVLLPGRSKDSILSKMKTMGIVLSEEERLRRSRLGRSLVKKDNFKVDQSLQLEDLDNQVLQILLGSMLGDGCSNRQSKNLRHYRFAESHCMEQADYLEWKAKMLSVFQPRFYIRPKWERADLVTLTHPIFTDFRAAFYEPNATNKSIIPLALFEKLDMLGFLIWYLDDGSLGSQPSIGAKGWDRDNLMSLTEIINKKFSLSVYVYECRHYDDINRVVKIPAKNKAIFAKWKLLAVEWRLPKSMFYKLER